MNLRPQTGLVLLTFFVHGLTLQAQSAPDLVQTLGALAGTDSSDVTVSSEDSVKQSGEAKAPAVLKVESTPSDASVSLNFAHAGRTPLELRTLTAGSYRITIAREKYQTVAVNVDLREGKTVSVNARLRQLTGFLDVTTVPEDCLILLEGSRLSPGLNELTIGDYELRVRKFGYTDEVRRVTIRHRQTERLGLRLDRAAFGLSNEMQVRPRFNPENPGLLGRSQLRFEVSAFGTGRLSLRDQAGQIVASHGFDRFTTWEQSWAWNGRSDGADFVKDGVYRLELELIAEESGGVIRRSWTVTVDRSLLISYRSLPRGLSGTLLAADSAVLPPGGLQLASDFMAGLDPGWGRRTVASYPFGLAGRLGILDDLEGGLGVSARIKENTVPPDLAAGAALKFRLVALPAAAGWGAAVFAQGAYTNDPANDTQGLASGLRLGGALEGRLAWLHLSCSPSLEYAFEPAGLNLKMQVRPVGRQHSPAGAAGLQTGLSPAPGRGNACPGG
jgi:hypothetical protein